MIVKYAHIYDSYGDLTPNQQYFVIGIEANHYRILNDLGQPFLYPATLFDVTDASEPEDWITEYGDDGERYSYPPNLNDVGFFEDYFDRNTKAVSTFWQAVNRRLSKAA